MLKHVILQISEGKKRKQAKTFALLVNCVPSVLCVSFSYPLASADVSAGGMTGNMKDSLQK